MLCLKRTFPVSYAYFVFKKLYREFRDANVAWIDENKTNCIFWFVNVNLPYKCSTTTYRASAVCLPFLSVFWKLIMTENKFVQRITLGKFLPVTLHDRFTSFRFFIRWAFCWYYYSSHSEILRWCVFSFDDPVSTSYKSIEFFLRLNGFFRKSLRPLLAKFQAFGGEIECVRKEGWSFYQSSKLITYAPYNNTLFTCKSFAS